jgi:hypothetical protein
MAKVASTADLISRRVPKLLSPDAHRAADYILAGSFLASGAWFWRRNRRAAMASWICGGSLLGLSLLTSYPGKNRRHLAFPLHGKIETGMAAMVAAMPEVLRFPGDSETRYFSFQAALLTVISNLTPFSHSPRASDGGF